MVQAGQSGPITVTQLNGRLEWDCLVSLFNAEVQDLTEFIAVASPLRTALIARR